MRRLCLFLALVSSLSAAASAPVPLKPSRVTTSASASGSVAERIIDGDNRDSSRWISVQTRDPIWIELELPRIETLAGLHVYSGFEGARALRSFGVQFWRDNAWHPVPSAQVTGNAAPALALKFDDTVVVSTQRLRLWITETPDGTARVAEIVVWPASASGVPPVSPAGVEITTTANLIGQPAAAPGTLAGFAKPLSLQDVAPIARYRQKHGL